MAQFSARPATCQTPFEVRKSSPIGQLADSTSGIQSQQAIIFEQITCWDWITPVQAARSGSRPTAWAQSSHSR